MNEKETSSCESHTSKSQVTYHTITKMIIENKIPATNTATEAATVTVTADVALFAGLSFTVNKMRSKNYHTCTGA